jgi:hypothetical protein
MGPFFCSNMAQLFTRQITSHSIMTSFWKLSRSISSSAASLEAGIVQVADEGLRGIAFRLKRLYRVTENDVARPMHRLTGKMEGVSIATNDEWMLAKPCEHDAGEVMIVAPTKSSPVDFPEC